MATRIISEEEAEGMRLLPLGYKHPVRALIEQLKPGERLYIAPEDFTWKGKTPNFFCRQIAKTTGAKFHLFTERKSKGWVVERVE